MCSWYSRLYFYMYKLSVTDMDIPDTLTFARTDRENQGPWEAEYSYGGEADLHKHLDSCEKNPGHVNFIPLDKFSIDDLPEGYRDNDMVDYIRALSDLTVHVTVKYVSGMRPAAVPGSHKPYPCYSDRGRRRLTVGTGWVASAEVFSDPTGEACECKDCRNSSTPKTNFAIINIRTASHVVFGDLEGDHTTCHLFFDRGNVPDTSNGVVTLTGMSRVGSEIVNDMCTMLHFTHDLDLAHGLHEKLEQTYNLRDQIASKMPQSCKFQPNPSAPNKQPLMFIVSHPHGCSKQITLGRCTSVDMFNNIISTFRYTADTCPGSSGALVCLPQLFTPPDMQVTLFNFKETHFGASDVQLGTNYCHTDRDIPSFELVSLKMLQFDEGPWEVNFCFVDEEDLHKHYEACQKNPGHKNFFPVEEFSVDNLPPFCREDEIVKLIKIVSDLTVRVSVKCVSEERPETVPGTDMPYPWSSNRGSNQMRVGTGLIREVDILEDGTCHCKECKSSSTPKTGFARIYIETATHLVYDELEGQHTTCHLFFDSGETPDACKDVVTDRCDVYSTKVNDVCRMRYATHNLELARRLENMQDEYDRYLNSLTEYDYLNSTKDVKENVGHYTNQDTPLCIVVFHPHGCVKHVRIGYRGDTDNADTTEIQCPYNLPTCPGSAGAHVIVLGSETIYPICK